MLRTGKAKQYGARLRLSPRKWAVAPQGFARCKTEAICPRDFVRAGKSRHACINRETGQLLVAPLIFRSGRLRFRPLHSQNRPDSLMVAHRKVLVRPPVESLHGLPLAFYPSTLKTARKDVHRTGQQDLPSNRGYPGHSTKGYLWKELANSPRRHNPYCCRCPGNPEV